MKIAHIDENNKLLGWYDTEFHINIPEPNITVSDEVWQTAVQEGHNRVNADGTTELFDFRTDVERNEQMLKDMSNIIQQLLDETARSKRYDNIMSVRSYCGWDSPFRAECENIAYWAAQCWVVAGQIEQDVINGIRTMPTVDQLLSELPVYTPLT